MKADSQPNRESRRHPRFRGSTQDNVDGLADRTVGEIHVVALDALDGDASGKADEIGEPVRQRAFRPVGRQKQLGGYITEEPALQADESSPFPER